MTSDAGLTMAMVRAVLEALPDAVMALTTDGHVHLCNGVAARMFGYAQHELLGQHGSLLLPVHLRPGGRPAESMLFEPPAVPAHGAWRRNGVARRRDGSTFPIEVATTAIPIEDEICHLAVIRDTADRLLLETQVLRLNDALVGIGEDPRDR